MALFYTYQDEPVVVRTEWKTTSDTAKALSQLYDCILTSDSNLYSSDLFDTSRDEFHDMLNSEDPRSFPRMGHIGVSVMDILERLIPSSC